MRKNHDPSMLEGSGDKIMQRHLDLVKNDTGYMEKLIFPRFPYAYLTFKTLLPILPWTAEVVEISSTGMQIALKDGEMHLDDGEFVEGEIHWCAERIALKGQVRWSTRRNAGLEFDVESAAKVGPHLDPDSIIRKVKAVHLCHLDLELPANLKTWIHADGPLDVFVWTHTDGEVQKFQVIYLRDIIQWVDGTGLTTGRVLTKRNLDTPMFAEGEFLCRMDEKIDSEKISRVQVLLEKIPQEMLYEDYRTFIARKLGVGH